MYKNKRYSTNSVDNRVLLEDTVKPLSENSRSLRTDVYPKTLKSLVASEEMFCDFLPTILTDLLLIQCFLALSSFLFQLLLHLLKLL